MAVHVVGLVGIIFFYILITALGALITYRRCWLIKLWKNIKKYFCCGDANRGKHPPTNTNSPDEIGATQENIELATIEGDGNLGKSNDIALAGRSLGLLIGSFTLTAGWVGGSFISGTTEMVYNQGLLWTPAPFAYSLSLLVGGLMFSKTMRKNNYVTMLDPFQHRYGNLIGGLFLIPACIAELFWSLSLLTSLATMLSVVIGINIGISVGISASIAVLFTMFGGMSLLANTDLIQLTLIFLSLWACIPIILMNKNVQSITKNSKGWWAKEPLKLNTAAAWLDDVVYLIFGGIPWQTYFQKVLACKSTKVAYQLSFTASFFCLLMSIPPVLIGAAATTTNWSMYNLSSAISLGNETVPLGPFPEYALPATLVSLLPSTFLFICLGSLAASTISSTNSSMLSAATMMSHNLYKNVIRKNASSREVSIVLRVVIVLTGVAAVGLSFLITSVYELWYLSSDLVYVVLFPRLCSVVYFKFTNNYGGTVGSLVAVLLRFLCGEKSLKIPAIINLPPFNKNMQSKFPSKTCAMLVGLFLDLTISWLAYYMFVKKKINPKYDFLNMLKSRDFVESEHVKDSPVETKE